MTMSHIANGANRLTVAQVIGPALLLAALLGLAACGGRPLAENEVEEPGEIPPGPGLISGEDGALIYSTD